MIGRACHPGHRRVPPKPAAITCTDYSVIQDFSRAHAVGAANRVDRHRARAGARRPLPNSEMATTQRCGFRRPELRHRVGCNRGARSRPAARAGARARDSVCACRPRLDAAARQGRDFVGSYRTWSFLQTRTFDAGSANRALRGGWSECPPRVLLDAVSDGDFASPLVGRSYRFEAPRTRIRKGRTSRNRVLVTPSNLGLAG